MVAVVAKAVAAAATSLACRSQHQLRNTLLGRSKELEACTCRSRWPRHRKSMHTSRCSPLWSKTAIDPHPFGSRRHLHAVQNQRGDAASQASLCASFHIASSPEESLASCDQHRRKTKTSAASRPRPGLYARRTCCSHKTSPHACCACCASPHSTAPLAQETVGNLHGIAWEEEEVGVASVETAAAKGEVLRAARGAWGALVEGMVAGMVAVRVAKEARAAVAMGEERAVASGAVRVVEERVTVEEERVTVEEETVTVVEERVTVEEAKVAEEWVEAKAAEEKVRGEEEKVRGEEAKAAAEKVAKAAEKEVVAGNEYEACDCAARAGGAGGVGGADDDCAARDCAARAGGADGVGGADGDCAARAGGADGVGGADGDCAARAGGAGGDDGRRARGATSHYPFLAAGCTRCNPVPACCPTPTKCVVNGRVARYLKRADGAVSPHPYG